MSALRHTILLAKSSVLYLLRTAAQKRNVPRRRSFLRREKSIGKPLGFPMLFFAENGEDANFCTELSRCSRETTRQFHGGAKGIYKFPSRRSENVKQREFSLVLGFYH